MKLLNTFEDKEEAEDALTKIVGEKRLASERDGTQTIYNLFGQPTWGNFYKLDMFDLSELKILLELRNSGVNFNETRYSEILNALHHVAREFDLSIPKHWL
ncbi:TPA: hypothetical protein ACXJNB_000310 [Serratia marcescens]